MVIRNYHWLNSASPVLISTCSAPLVQTGKRKQFSLFDLDLWPTILTYNPRLAKVKVDPHAKIKVIAQNGWNRRVPTANRHIRTHTDKQTNTHTNAFKRIISPAMRSITIASNKQTTHKNYYKLENHHIKQNRDLQQPYVWYANFYTVLI